MKTNYLKEKEYDKLLIKILCNLYKENVSDSIRDTGEDKRSH